MQSTRAAGTASLLALAIGCEVPIEQPIRFNHAVHIKNDLKCLDCHQHFDSAEFSGLPGIEMCAECHEEPMTKSPEEVRLIEFTKRGEELPWQRVYDLPEDVFYSHRRHVVVAKIECKTCHGDVGRLTEPPEQPLVTQTMEWCIDCHLARGASVDCIHCHR